MKIKKRWIQAVVETAEKSEVKMPWTRGDRRAVMIAARKQDQPKRLSA